MPKYFIYGSEAWSGEDSCNFNSNNRILSNGLSSKLLKMYVLADHAAYHFLSDHKTDYSHADMKNVENKMFLHNILTQEPNEKIQSFIYIPSKPEAKIKSLFIMNKGDYSDISSESESDSDS
jgi:hypothetical protein